MTATSRNARSRGAHSSVGDHRREALEELELIALHDAAHDVDDPPVVDGAGEVVALGARAGDGLQADVDDEDLADSALFGR